MDSVKWIKICTDIFDDEKICLIESMPNGESIVLCWFKLLCMAGKQNNSGVFMFNKIAYTDEMLATIFRRPVELVRLSIKTFVSFGMVEIVDNVYIIPNWGKHQSIDRIEERNEYMRNYMREYRAKQKGLAAGNFDEETQETKEQKKEAARRFIPPTLEEVRAYCKERKNNVSPERFFDFYTAKGWKVGKNTMKDWRAAVRTWEREEAQPQAQNVQPRKTVEFWQGG